MSVEVIDHPPAPESLTLLSDFQSETPSTFFGERPVLHFHSKSQLLISKSDLEDNEVFQKLTKDSQFDWTDDSDASTLETAIPEVEIYALSTKLIIFSTGSSGLSIPYPSIALHAKGTRRSSRLPDGQSDVVYLQFNLHDPETINSDDEIQTVDLTIVPSDVTYPRPEDAVEGTETPSPSSLLFEALSDCANLHPDPESGSEGAAEPAPGTGGWITSENMADFMDADGNLIGIPTLGAGAGNVHARNDDDGDEIAAVNGAEESDDTKWQKTG